MSLIQDFAQKELLIQKLKDEMSKMEANSELQAEMEFKEKLETLMKGYEKTASDVVSMLASEKSNAQPQKTSGRQPRRLKRYTHPETGETVDTRGGNNKVVKEWKQSFGSEKVESLAYFVEDKAA